MSTVAGVRPAMAAFGNPNEPVEFLENGLAENSSLPGYYARGDLSSTLVPRTNFTLNNVGVNVIIGEVANAKPILDDFNQTIGFTPAQNDAFTFVVPAGRRVASFAIQTANYTVPNGTPPIGTPYANFSLTGVGNVATPLSTADQVGLSYAFTGPTYTIAGAAPLGPGTYTFNAAMGANTNLSSSVLYRVAIQTVAAPVPEPTTLAGLAGLGTALAARRRRPS